MYLINKNMPLTYITLILIVTACTNNNSNNKIRNGIKNDSGISVPKFSNIDKIIDSTPNYYLVATKTATTINLKYKRKGSEKDSNISFPFSNYSEVVFPDTAIGLIQNKTYVKMKYYLFGDSLLILPLIGVNNLLSIYIINLKNGELIGDGENNRTSLNLVWVYVKKGEVYFITSDTPLEKGGFVKYVLITSKIKKDSLEEIRRNPILLKKNIDDNLQLEYQTILKYLSNKGGGKI
jgi:hypothetical protein